MSDLREFFVEGVPQPKGNIIRGPHGGYHDANNRRLKPWLRAIVGAAQAADVEKIVAGPVVIRMTFTLPRPKYHFGTGRNADLLKVNAPTLHATRPDADKLMRAVLDALTGVAWTDDSQVARWSGRKQYGARPGVLVRLCRESDGAL